MRMRYPSSALLLVVAIALAAVPVIAFLPDTPQGFPVSIENCGITTTYVNVPKRAFTMNQAATEIMLALGLEDHMVGTASLDDEILPAFARAYDTIGVRTTGYPSGELLFEARSDFVYAAYP